MLTARLTFFFSCFALVTPTCVKPVEISIDDDLKFMLTDIHNELRNRVAMGDELSQSPAQNMRTLQWSTELETEAQNWADQCEFSHDPILKESRHGQNIYLVSTTSKNFNMTYFLLDGAHEWYNEVQLGYNGTYRADTGHYSQMIWGETKKVGCGVSMDMSGLYTDFYLVCNYSPGGNVIGKPPYKYGTVACEQNEMFRSEDYSHLCDITAEMLMSCNLKSKETVKVVNDI